MCELCGQAHQDMRVVLGHTVCSSARWCLLHTLREADDLSIARMQKAALRTLLQPHRTELTA